MKKVRYEKMKVADLKKAVDKANPRTIKIQAKGALAASIARFGLVQPLVYNATTKRMVGGHQRLDSLPANTVEVDVCIGEWTEDEERALNVALNNPAAQGEFTTPESVAAYLGNSLKALTLGDFKALRFDELVLTPPEREKKSRKAGRGLEYKLVIACRDEAHQAELLDELEAKGLECKVLIV